jgi:hypothetical protein
MRAADEIRSESHSALFLVTSGLPRLLGRYGRRGAEEVPQGLVRVDRQ